MTIDSEMMRRTVSMASPMRLAGLVLCALQLLAVAACSGNAGANLRDCSQWRTESIPGCYDGQGGGKV